MWIQRDTTKDIKLYHNYSDLILTFRAKEFPVGELRWGMDIFKVDALALPKFAKRHFFGDIENSFHKVTHTGLEPHQFFSFENISTNTVARDVQSFG